MAGTLTHFKFGNDLYARLNDSTIDKQYFLIGNQGHDLLYFIKLYEYPLKKKYDFYAKELQNMDINNFLKKQINNPQLKSFMYGYLAHQILDNYVHPYINETVNYDMEIHSLLETKIDVLLNDLSKEKKIIPKHLKLSKDFKKELKTIFDEYYLNDVFSKRIIKSINRVYPFLKHYRFDKTGIKKLGYSLINAKKFRFLSFNFKKEELDIEIDRFITLYNEALYQATLFLTNLNKND